jgi:hypothetical protein
MKNNNDPENMATQIQLFALVFLKQNNGKTNLNFIMEMRK